MKNKIYIYRAFFPAGAFSSVFLLRVELDGANVELDLLVVELKS